MIANQMTSENKTNVLSLPLTVDGTNVRNGVLEIVRNVKPLWNIEHVELKIFTDGCTNQLFGCIYKPPNEDSSKSVESNNTKENTFLVRIYGNNTDVLIDRDEEIKNIILLYSCGFGTELYATFRNGIAYEYSPGEQVTKASIYDERVWRQIAKRMAELHRDVRKEGQSEAEPFCWTKICQFQSLVPNAYANSEIQLKRDERLPPNDQLQAEYAMLYTRLSKTKSPIVFAHNDLLPGNIIFDEGTDQVTFIDFEYAACNYQAFDIGNHFAEFAGMTEIDYTRYPNKTFQFEWLRVYLTNYHKFDGRIVDDEYINRIYADVNKFALVAHFTWTLWALIQAEHSTIDYDFIDFAATRYNEYLRRRDEFLAL